jgi:hypothetical protein
VPQLQHLRAPYAGHSHVSHLAGGAGLGRPEDVAAQRLIAERQAFWAVALTKLEQPDIPRRR